MTSDEALRDIRGFAAAGRVRFTRHARERAAERAGGELQVIGALRNATACEPSEDKWKVSGPDLDGDDLTAVVVVEAGVVVVTVF